MKWEKKLSSDSELQQFFQTDRELFGNESNKNVLFRSRSPLVSYCLDAAAKAHDGCAVWCGSNRGQQMAPSVHFVFFATVHSHCVSVGGARETLLFTQFGFSVSI